jgi:hypothetical protein
MKSRLAVSAAAAALVAVALGAAPASAAGDDCNWGRLTVDLATSGPGVMGGHASEFAGARRTGLANILDRGDLAAVCELLSGG